MRLVIDTIEFGATHTPKFNPISISGYHIREAGSTAIQELAFTLRDGIEYVERACGAAWRSMTSRRGCRSSSTRTTISSRRSPSTAPRGASGTRRCASASARRMRARGRCAFTRRRRDARSPRSSRTTTWCAPRCRRWPRCMGGTQSLHTNSLDEAWALPTELAATLALRTQQIIAHESGVANTADPLGGSYFVESLTDEIERGALRLHPQNRRFGRHGAGHRTRVPAARNRRGVLQYQQAIDRQRQNDRRRK